MNNTQKFLVDLLSIAKSVEGRKKIQKISYILQEKGAPINVYFKYHLYGPYSADLQVVINEMVGYKYLSENSKKDNVYSYALGKNSKTLTKTSRLGKYKSFITSLNQEQSEILEIIATIYFLKTQDEKYKKNDNLVKEKIKILKPSLSNKLEEAFGKYKELDKFVI